MERVQDLFREGVMTHLDRLESLSQNLSRRHDEKRRQEAELQEKRAVMLRLQEERDELRERIRLQDETIRSSARSEQRAPSAPNTQSALQDLRLEEMRSLMEGLWFTGISGKLKDGGACCFCISAAYEGRYLNSYYLQVNDVRSPQITRHSLPPFIPLAHLAERHLPADLKTLLRVLCQQLNAYEGRKFQADQMEKISPAYVDGSLQKNSLHSVLSFRYNISLEGRSVSFSAKILYGDIASAFPSQVTVTCSDGESSAQEMISSHVSLFYNTALHRALDSLAA